MLTGDLVRTRVVKKSLVPSLVNPTNKRLLERAATLVDLMGGALEAGHTRGHIEEMVREIAGMDVDHKITKGLAKLLMDKGQFETQSPIDPAALRWQVFSEAAKRGPIGRTPSPGGPPVAMDVLAEVGKDLGTDAESVARGLYADLKQEQVLAAMPLPKPEVLLHRYNTALVQALLLKASHLVVELSQPHPKYVRQMMRYLKFHQLMYRCTENTDGVRFEVDGPQSLLKLSTRYGLQLANFFPAVLLQSGPWSLRAEVLWGRKRKFKKVLELDSESGLVSHYRDTGTWTSRTETWFVERFSAFDTEWKMGPGEPIDLGGQHMMIPDLSFRKGDKVGHLEICGFWRAKHLKERIAQLPDNVILAVSSKLKGEAGKLTAAMEAKVIRFAEVIPPAKVVDRLEQVAR